MRPSAEAEYSHEHLESDESRSPLQFGTVAGRVRPEFVLSVICRCFEYTLRSWPIRKRLASLYAAAIPLQISLAMISFLVYIGTKCSSSQRAKQSAAKPTPITCWWNLSAPPTAPA